MEECNKNVNEIFICKCYNVEHQLVFTYNKDWNEVFVSVHLNPEYRWWKRVWFAIKYIFGYRCMYGHFDEFIFNRDDTNKLQNIVNFLKDVPENNTKN